MRRQSKRPEIRGTCIECGKNVGTYIPKGGDGSQRNAYLHTSKQGKQTAFRVWLRTCPGSKHAVAEWDR